MIFGPLGRAEALITLQIFGYFYLPVIIRYHLNWIDASDPQVRCWGR